MLGEIIEIKNNCLTIGKSKEAKIDIINLYAKIIDNDKQFVGEIIGVNKNEIGINLVGEIIDNKFIYGVNRKPSLDSRVNLLPENDINLLFGLNNYNPRASIYLGKSALYKDMPIFANMNRLFSNHLVVLGNTGSGKSCGMARLLQNLFYKKELSPKNATFFIIDAYGEYHNAFSRIDAINKDLNFKNYTTDIESNEKLLKIPLWLLGLDDICLLLGVNNKNQIPIVEKALKIVNIFSREEESVITYKNSIIAKSLLDIFINGHTPAQIRDQIFSVLSRFNTRELNLETKIFLPGYTRPLKQCLMIDDTGKIRDMQLVINFLQKFVLDEMNLTLPDGSYIYTLKDLLYAFDFALIDEGLLNGDRIYSLAHELRVRLASIIDSNNYKYFDIKEYYDKNDFFKKLTTVDNNKAQVINLNLNSLDDRFAKVVAKIYSKFLFDYVKEETRRAEVPIHIVLEEAHRYVQNDADVEILGYNIFERIAKEGRKYAILLNLISQRPSELSQTVLSQCSNFLVFKITHPNDIEYIKPMIPFVDEEMIERIKNLQIGCCLTFGSAFQLPTIVKVDLATPAPSSSNCDISNKWF
ncbi:MAG: DUF87 domain-containing protein [Firmicutes bacterium]|nr:DUF87 domain-containing protein [Bacillota bacterium]